jgi:hypothetical protein
MAMGIDVFGVFQKREDERWRSIRSFYDGQRGFVRGWLGWDWGSYSMHPIVAPRGLPSDFESSEQVDDGEMGMIAIGDIVGSRCQSWLNGDEILSALPALGTHTLKVPMKVYEQSWHLESDPERWKVLTGLSQDPYLPKLVGISSRPGDISHDAQEFPVDCLYDLSDYVTYFTDEVQELQDLYGTVRFVYGFA